jgi:AcrR family transcriptional regulator
MKVKNGKRGRPRDFDRTEALVSAMKVFWAKGYEGAAISDLKAEMGIGSPSLYAAFSSKEELFREAVALYNATEGNQIWQALQTAPTAREGIEGVLMHTARAFSRPHMPPGCLVVLSALNTNDSNEPIRHDLVERRSKCVKVMEARLKQAVIDGQISPDVDVRSIATFYVTVHQGMSIQARDGASAKTLESIAQSAMSAWESLTSVPAKQRPRRQRSDRKQPSVF